MIDWTKISSDPCNLDALSSISQFLKSSTKLYECTKQDLIIAMARDKVCLDIGAGEHDISYFSEKWEHAIYKKQSKKMVGIDINQDLVNFYNNKGFDFRCVDACSDADLGEKFEFIHLGDVIEHVDNPVALIKFCFRHMQKNSALLVSTPNPCFKKFKSITQMRNDLFFMSNLEHISWIVPTHMLEIVRRSKTGLNLDSILLPKYANEALQIFGGSVEEYFEDYIYVLKS
jgi:2-polyprenyl-3-methyl-5-hydroxy-6-metoxy-1,4-benzoquinol methylase